MKRLTKEIFISEKRCYTVEGLNNVVKSNAEIIGEIVDKLAAYENTGLQPLEVVELQKENEQLKQQLEYINKQFHREIDISSKLEFDIIPKLKQQLKEFTDIGEIELLKELKKEYDFPLTQNERIDYLKTIAELKQQLTEKQSKLKHLYSFLGIEAFGDDGDLVSQEATKEISRLQEKEELLKNTIAPELSEEKTYFIIYKNNIVDCYFNGQFECLRTDIVSYCMLFHEPYKKLNGFYQIKDIFVTKEEAEKKLKEK